MQRTRSVDLSGSVEDVYLQQLYDRCDKLLSDYDIRLGCHTGRLIRGRRYHAQTMRPLTELLEAFVREYRATQTGGNRYVPYMMFGVKRPVRGVILVVINYGAGSVDGGIAYDRDRKCVVNLNVEETWDAIDANSTWRVGHSLRINHVMRREQDIEERGLERGRTGARIPINDDFELPF